MLKVAVAECSEGLLKTDISIIDHDGDYVVFSVRVPKSSITKNHSFLSAISNMAEGSNRNTLGSDKRIKRRLGVLALVSAIIISPVAIATNWALTIVMQSLLAAVTAEATQPVEIASIHVVNSKLKAGDDLITISVGRRIRDCISTVDRSFMRNSDNTTVMIVRTPTVYTTSSTEFSEIRTAIAVPESMKPGYYTYRSTVISSCPEKIYTIKRPDVTFQVVS
jgi:hypothetical protein